MHSIQFIRNNSSIFNEGMISRGIRIRSEEIILIDNIIKNNKNKIEKLQHQRKELAKIISSLQANNKDFSPLKEKGYKIKIKIAILQQENKDSENKLNNILVTLPNIPEKKILCTTNNNSILYTIGKPKHYDFPVRSHYDIGKSLKMMDFKTATKISGSRFVILKKDLVKLERALTAFMIDIHTNEFNFEEIMTPVLVLEKTMYEAGQLPKFTNDSFKTTNGYRLIPTSEVPLVCMSSNKILEEYELPLRYVSYAQCFRSEAGSAGKDTKGMTRQHQFSKVELVSIVKPNKSKSELERIINAAETILKRLDLHYRVSLLCTQDISFCAQKTYDLEVWLPYEKKYREISSCSNCSDFQARRMNARYKSSTDNKNYFVHTLNGSGLAIGRTIIAIIENYQNGDGTISIPNALQPFMGYKNKIG